MIRQNSSETRPGGRIQVKGPNPHDEERWPKNASQGDFHGMR